MGDQQVRGGDLKRLVDALSPDARSAWPIVRLGDRKPSVVQPLADVREQVVLSIRTRKMQEAERTYIEGLLSKSNVQVNQGELQKLQSWIK